jgi:3-hydroxybutyryl-CoA dehydrogenase
MGHRKGNENSGSTIRRVAVLGAGVMGHSMAQVFAQHNCSVSLYDIGEDILKTALERIHSNLTLYVEMGLENETFVDDALSRIRTSTSLRDALQGAEFVTEAVPEDLNMKMEIFKEVDAVTNDSVILASNTSSLSITEIGRSVRNARRLIITHWFNPPHLVPVVEVVKGEYTSQETFERTVQFLKAMDKEPVHVLKQVPGFLVNRIQTAMFREVIALLEDGVASPEDIDTAVRGSFGLRLAVMGPLTVVDLAGVHLWHKGAQNLYPVLDASKEPRKMWTEMVEKGFLGERTGKGFFEYPTGRAAAIIRDRDMKLIRLLNILRDTKGTEE